MNDMTMTSDTAPDTPATMIEEYISLRDQLKVANDTFAGFVEEHYGKRMKELELALLDTLNKMGVDSLASSNGTAYKKLSTSVTIADARDFRRHVIGAEEWDLLDWRANKTAVNDRVEQGDPLPPGLNRSTFYSVGIRRKSQ